jgi:hypothetical protein
MPVRNQHQIIKSAHGTQTQKAQCKMTPDQESHGTHHQECPSYSYISKVHLASAIATPNCIMNRVVNAQSEKIGGFSEMSKVSAGRICPELGVLFGPERFVMISCAALLWPWVRPVSNTRGGVCL